MKTEVEFFINFYAEIRDMAFSGQIKDLMIKLKTITVVLLNTAANRDNLAFMNIKFKQPLIRPLL